MAAIFIPNNRGGCDPRWVIDGSQIIVSILVDIYGYNIDCVINASVDVMSVVRNNVAQEEVLKG